MAWENGLHNRQLEAVRHRRTHARLLAGPGTGKTLTLTRRLVKLVIEDGVPPENILAVAFTRINANDLRRSVADELAQYHPKVRTVQYFTLCLYPSSYGHFSLIFDGIFTLFEFEIHPKRLHTILAISLVEIPLPW